MSHLALYTIKKKTSGRDAFGHVSTRHRGGEQKRFLRLIDWKREKSLSAKVIAIEYDPNRTADIALLNYQDGEKRYIIAPSNLKVGDIVTSGPTAAIKDGNHLPLKNIPVGVPIHCLEITPGRGAQMIKSAGSAAFVQSIDDNIATVKLPSGEIRLFNANCYATIGQVGNADLMNQKLTKAGQMRHRGIRPTVRGVAQHPDSHPHGGGEGRSSVGMNPKTPWGKPAMGKKTRAKKKASNKLIVKHRS
ncbi:50S ribosomal protein L2 [Patescibacteria group bacterium]|nr:50S ribosomal protein L2 [Patescibacteria group bacterium]